MKIDVKEVKLEIYVPDWRIQPCRFMAEYKGILETKEKHPYEEPVINVIPLLNI